MEEQQADNLTFTLHLIPCELYVKIETTYLATIYKRPEHMEQMDG